MTQRGHGRSKNSRIDDELIELVAPAAALLDRKNTVATLLALTIGSGGGGWENQAVSDVAGEAD
mgnify:CR=1 FL=1